MLKILKSGAVYLNIPFNTLIFHVVYMVYNSNNNQFP